MSLVPLLTQNALLLTHTCYETCKISFCKLEISIQNERYFMYSFLCIIPNVLNDDELLERKKHAVPLNTYLILSTVIT